LYFVVLKSGFFARLLSDLFFLSGVFVLFFCHHFLEVVHGSVVGFFSFRWEVAAYHLARFAVVFDTFTTDAMSRARSIGTGTFRVFSSILTFHIIPSIDVIN
jgi:hypothetical protein